MAYPYSHQNYPPQPGQNIVGPSGDIQSQQGKNSKFNELDTKHQQS